MSSNFADLPLHLVKSLFQREVIALFLAVLLFGSLGVTRVDAEGVSYEQSQVSEDPPKLLTELVNQCDRILEDILLCLSIVEVTLQPTPTEAESYDEEEKDFNLIDSDW